MLSKNNYQERLRKMDDKQERFSIRKFSVGAASVLVGTAVLTMQNVQTARADTTSNTTTKTTDLSSEAEEQNKQNAYDKTLNEAQPTTKPADAPVESQDSKVASFSVPKNEGTFVEKTLTPNITEETETETMQDKAELAQVNSEDKSAENNKTNVKEESQTVEANQMDKRSAEANISDTENTLVSNTTLNVPKTTPATTRFSATALSESKFQVNAPRVGQDTPDTQVKKNNYKLVTNATALQQAINTGVAGVNIDRSIDASNVDLAIRNTFTIVGLNDAAALNLGQKSLNNSGNLTLQDIKINGSISGSGTVNIKGNVTSNINSTNSSVPTQDQYNAQNYTGSRTNFKNSNIAARNVNIENGASLTINSSEINDGINLADGGTVKVGDNATLNVNLTNTSTTATRYHVAGVFAKNGGNFISGYKSNVNFNTGLGQAIAIGATRPTSTDADRYGGYGTRSRNDGPTLVQLGDSSTFNFTGRDGIILGNNANFISGENSNVHFENKGRGVALDLANNSNIEISKHSITSFHSVGKTGTSGSFDGYNYIGVNEGGNITVDEYATFRVILEGRGDNPWDDVISLDSRNANTNAAFTSKTGAIVDIRDDNTNFYAELISFPLGSANSRIDIQDPLMLNLQRYSNGGATTGWMATGGDKINTTSAQYTSNLIYMGGNNGVFSVSGGDYDPSNPNSSGFVVYQQIKSDGSKQIWLNVNSVDIPMNGFQTKDIWNNQANPDVSIVGNGLTAGIKANQVHNFDGSPLTGPNAPYYGISTQRASHQIWIPHRTSLEVTGEHKSTIKYVDENGKEIFPENTQSLDMKRSLILDITQDKIQDIQNYALSHTADETLEYIKNSQAVVQDSGWEFTDANGKAVIDPYSTIDSPKLAGYAATIQSTNVSTLKVGEDASAVTAKFMVELSQDMVQNGELSTAYKQNGTTGIPADYVTVVVYNKQATYQAGKTDSKSVVRDINYLDGKTGKKIPANLIKDNPVSQTVTMHRTEILDNSGKVIGYGTISEDGKSYTLNNDWIIDGNWEAVKSPDLTANGYKTPRFENGDIAKVVPAETVNENTPDTTVNVYYDHNEIPVGPDTPDKHGVDLNELTKDVNETVHYVYSDGTKAAPDVVQTSKWTRTLTIDAVTNEVISDGQYTTDWAIPKGEKTVYDQVDTPVIKGYHADKRQINATVVTQNNIEETVTYQPNGKIIPVDPNGDPIPNVPTPTYPTDPTDPTKVVPDEPVPEIPGLIPSVPTVTPENPGKDTPVPYTPEVPAKDQVAVVNYIDADDSNAIITSSGNLTGKAGEKIDYSTASTIEELENKGYVLVSDGFPAGATFDNDDNTTQIYTVVLKHGTVPVTPENPGKPGEPINPNDPDGPKWPEGTGENGIKRTGTQTIHYEGAGDKTPGDDVQTFDFTKKMLVDKVTGKIIDAGEWNVTSHKFGYKDTPVIEGYHADKRNAGGSVVTPEDLNKEIVVTYQPNGKIIPVDPNGDPIPNVPTPTYPTDPTDPTKVVPDEPVPEIPGLIPSVPTVTPENPGKDTPVPYTPVKDPDKVTTVEGKQIIHFVDGDNNKPLKDPNIQTYEFKITNGVPNESSHTFTLVNVPVIPGYVAEIKSAGGKTVTPDKPLAEVTVVYHKIGKIVPVDPNGNPIPNVPTPSYTNDPTDPTKVVPNEPVPAIPGKTPDKTTVTPIDPTKDTPVVYKDDKVPPAPNTQKAVVNFIDVNTGKIISTSGILSGHPGEEINKLFSSAEVIKQLEAAGYEVVYNAFDGDGVIKYFDNDGNTIQQFTIALKLKEKAKTPDPVLPDPEVPVEKETQSEQPVKQNVAVPTPEKPVEKKTTDNKEVLPQTGADSNEAATILGAVATAIGMTSLIGAKRRKKDDK
ncbi:mucin-binding protein [Lactobacillus johnsonii]|uniref:YSIRK-type signal peptide-containing protein n=1 Tax=Lactobacillus johnsonii TaxID=33959 RepID=A0AAW5M3C6_LACJH|nr:YSIRK-type signal peptide-containing protein [Lactobacillus johnsonii]MCR1914721.1 YSIRK-type signal peptide-containing protein [Lactobacillus johnsonii]